MATDRLTMDGLRATVNELWPGQAYVSKAQREAAARRIGLGYADGRLSLTEFDERLAAVWKVSTPTELQALVMDLPADTSVPEPATSQRVDRRGLRLVTMAWAGINLIHIVIWTITCLVTLHLENPWWIWSFAIPGALLAGAWWYTNPDRQRGPWSAALDRNRS
jgi:hypothetical protein